MLLTLLLLLTLGLQGSAGQAALQTSAANEELWEAARSGDAERVTRALGKGADVNARTRDGATALTFAAGRARGDRAKRSPDLAGAPCTPAGTTASSRPMT